MESLVTFVCQHGAGKSRIAAALFNAAAPPGWRATSAGIEPQEQPSAAAASMLVADPAAAELDTTAPRPLGDTHNGMVVAIDCDIPEARQWMLTHEWPDPQVLAELRALTAELIAGLNLRLSSDQHGQLA
ncbi:hypothetical protein Rhe02_16970 [Rhizocola hellebori]|uniref:Phosphotyrosine protein phosphatase I domain-containing protein n=1 Tax=Rhizocola hellebori TaxID=1392758 RepID=A0A8J3Q4E9_9ACTN|nr:hypothetical protein [Rhizocola hellebori]GIH03630.1 hypothetical protein Rhe02_16970 [Rhizocola hellebori]